MNDQLVGVLLANALILLGLLVELGRTRRKSEVSAHELRPNQGTTVKDSVGRIEQTVDGIAGQVSTLNDRLIVVETRQQDWLNLRKE